MTRRTECVAGDVAGAARTGGGPHALRTALAVVVVAAVLGPAGEGAAQVRPSSAYRTLETAHFRVTFAAELEEVARRAATSAERSRAFLVSQLTPEPRGKVDILVVDDVDFSNGFANVFPSNRIVVYARPPVDEQALVYNTDWMELVVAHELTHIYHLDRTGGLGRVIRAVFGRLPFFISFPAVATPSWSKEGLAVDIESAYTGQGRLHGANHEMIVRTAVLHDRMDRMDRLNESSPIWPGDQRVYVYGSLFMDYLSRRYGPDVHRRLLDRTASAWLPPFLFFDRVAAGTFGQTFDEAYAAWHEELRGRYAELADSLRSQGITESVRLTQHPRQALYPRASPDGRRLAYAAEDGRSVPSTRIIDLETGRIVASHRRNGLSATSWTPDGQLVISQLEFRGPYRILFDLWSLGAGGRRITDGDRVEDPDVAPDGERIVAVQNGGGATRLVRVLRTTGELQPITRADPAVLWSYPRWSPDGTRIAAARWRRGGEYDIVVIDTLGAVLATVVTGRDVNQSPAWSADGRWVLFSSERTGISNLYAVDVSAAPPRLRQVTNVLTGAFQPDVSPDGRSIYFTGYHADGYAIERMPFDPSAWRDPAPARPIVTHPGGIGTGAAGNGDGQVAMQAAIQDAQQGPIRNYSPWRTLAPRAWEPLYSNGGAAGRFIGFATGGADLVGRHSFDLQALYDVRGSGRWDGFFGYSNARLGNPVLRFEASRSWDDLGPLRLDNGAIAERIEREDAIAGLLTLTRRRWRNVASLSVGIERESLTRSIPNSVPVSFRDARDVQRNLLLRGNLSAARTPLFAVSREDGFSMAFAATRSTESESTVFADSTGRFPRDYDELRAVATAFKSLSLGGFAHHVIALRTAAHVSSGPAPQFEGVGGSSGGSLALFTGFDIGGGSRLLPVRGFSGDVLIGSHAWASSLEWRIPIALVGRRPLLSPFYIDRIAAAAFVDAGNAGCTGEQQDDFSFCRNAEAAVSPIVGAGAELMFDLRFAGIIAGRLRTGVGFPVRGHADGAKLYLEIGSAF